MRAPQPRGGSASSSACTSSRGRPTISSEDFPSGRPFVGRFWDTTLSRSGGCGAGPSIPADSLMVPAFKVLSPDDPLHDQALGHTFAQWNDLLTREGYAQYNRAQLRTSWGAQHLQRVGLVSDGMLLASAKRYRVSVRLDGRTVPTIGIGAVFTPPEHRGRGHAAALIEHIVDAAHADGAALAMLFSEIAPHYYERLGFSVVPMLQALVGVPRRPGAPAVLVRSGEPRDLDLIVQTHHQRATGYRFSLSYDPEWLQYPLAKKRMLSALGPP